MGGLFGGGDSGPSAEELKAGAKANWQSLESERGSITGKYHGLLARLSAGGGRTGGDSALADIYKQQYQQEIGTLEKSQRYKDIGEYYNRQTGKSGGLPSKGGGRVGIKGGGAGKLGMNDWYKYQFGTAEQKSELQPQVDIYQKEIDAAAEKRRQERARNEDYGAYEG
jgi:hypothetical protein